MKSKERTSPINPSPPPPPTGVVATRIQLFLEKISPLSNDLAAGGKRKAAALRKLRRLCETEVDKLRKGFALPTVKLYLSNYRNALRAIDPSHPANSSLASIRTSSASVTWP